MISGEGVTASQIRHGFAFTVHEVSGRVHPRIVGGKPMMVEGWVNSQHSEFDRIVGDLVPEHRLGNTEFVDALSIGAVVFSTVYPVELQWHEPLFRRPADPPDYIRFVAEAVEVV